MAEGPAVVERGQVREDVQARKDAEGDRPEDEAAGDDHVEHRLQQDGEDERGVRRSFDAPLGDEQLDRVAAAGRDQGVDAGACDVGAEQLAPPHVPIAVRGLDDVPPCPRDGKQLAEVAGDREAEPLPVDLREVVEEHRDRVPRGVEHTLSVTGVAKSGSASRSHDDFAPGPFVTAYVCGRGGQSPQRRR